MELGITEKEHNIILNILQEYFDKYAFYLATNVGTKERSMTS